MQLIYKGPFSEYIRSILEAQSFATLAGMELDLDYQVPYCVIEYVYLPKLAQLAALENSSSEMQAALIAVTGRCLGSKYKLRKSPKSTTVDEMREQLSGLI